MKSNQILKKIFLDLIAFMFRKATVDTSYYENSIKSLLPMQKKV